MIQIKTGTIVGVGCFILIIAGALAWFAQVFGKDDV